MPEPILTEGETCWRIARANRAAVLVDGAAYFSAVRAALLKARRTVFIVGWDIDSRTPLTGPSECGQTDGAPDTLRAFLIHLVERQPDLCIHILLWDYAIVYAVERELLPAYKLGWQTPPQIKVGLDDALPFGACHHQKIVVIDDAVAFSGGLDLTIRRWDTPAHRVKDPARVDPEGKPYGPFHDVQVIVDGAAAEALARLVRLRWSHAVSGALAPVAPSGDPWPEDVKPDFRDQDIGIARTLPALGDRVETREVEALFLRSIEAAERCIYIENQYLTADSVAEALCSRLRDNPELEAIIVSPKDPHGWLEARSMGAGRVRFMHRLQEAGVGERLRLVYPAAEDGSEAVPIMVHAKVMAVDDRFLRVGSANLNNRSMGLDSECDLAVEAANAEQAQAIAGIRNRLLAEHLGVEPKQVADALAEHASIVQVVDDLGSATRYLVPIGDQESYDDEFSQVVREIADRERPIDPEEFVGDMFGAVKRKEAGRITKLALVAVALVGLVLMWHATPLGDLADPQLLQRWLDSISTQPWAAVAILSAYLIGGLLAFPITVLIAITAMAFGPWMGLLYAAGGSFLSAAATYEAGAYLGRAGLRDLLGPRLNRISRAAGDTGVLSVLTMRIVPVAPFTLVNLVCGASHIRFRDYAIGTILGMAPGIAIMTVLGDQLRSVWNEPSALNLTLFVVAVLAWLGLSLALQRLVSRLRRSNAE